MLTVYIATWCDFCATLRAALTEHGIAFAVVDVEQDDEAATFVKSVNNGNRITPTVRFIDGSTLTNPSVVQVKERLAASR